MKHLYRVCAGVVLLLTFSLPTFAGQSPCDGIAEPPPPATTEADGNMTTWVVEAVMPFLLSVF